MPSRGTLPPAVDAGRHKCGLKSGADTLYSIVAFTERAGGRGVTAGEDSREVAEPTGLETFQGVGVDGGRSAWTVG